MQSSLTRATSDAEYRILDTVKGSADSLEAEIGKLTSRLHKMSCDHGEDPFRDFSYVHQNQLVKLSEQLAQIWEHQRASDEGNRSLEVARNSTAAQNRILGSLQFPQMRERRDEICKAYENTYEWLLQDDTGRQNDWHNFVSWAGRVDNGRTIYWIYGKPGEFLKNNVYRCIVHGP